MFTIKFLLDSTTLDYKAGSQALVFTTYNEVKAEGGKLSREEFDSIMKESGMVIKESKNSNKFVAFPNNSVYDILSASLYMFKTECTHTVVSSKESLENIKQEALNAGVSVNKVCCDWLGEGTQLIHNEYDELLTTKMPLAIRKLEESACLEAYKNSQECLTLV